jgi:alpha-glucosidase
MNANLGLSGQPFVGSDIGGFAGASDEELLTRWYQYGAFQPFMRNHVCKGAPEHYPWSFGPAAERRIRAAVELRYSLLPYVYTAFVEAAETGEPIQRPLVYEWQAESETRTNATEYLFGRHLLVAPVLEPGAASRSLYLPPGSWRCFHTGAPHSGGRRLEVAVSPDRIPVFVRAGAVIPRIRPPRTTDGAFPRTVELHVYVPERAGRTASMLQEDDGLTDGYRRGEFVRTRFELCRKGRTLELRAATEGDGFPEFRRRRFRLVFHGADLPPCTVPNRGEPFAKTYRLP